MEKDNKRIAELESLKKALLYKIKELQGEGKHPGIVLSDEKEFTALTKLVQIHGFNGGLKKLVSIRVEQRLKNVEKELSKLNAVTEKY